jgi:hypothetical protein
MSTGLKRLFDQIGLRFASKGRVIDGVWIDAIDEGDPDRARQKVEAAFALINQHDPIQYKRICRHLKRIWILFVPAKSGCYDAGFDACLLNEKYVLSDSVSVENIASTIVHEATHARLRHWGIRYEEKQRSPLERICIGREVALLKRLPNCDQLLSQTEYKRQYCATHPEFFSDTLALQRHIEGSLKALRELDTPAWVINVVIASYRIRGKYRATIGLVRCSNKPLTSLYLSTAGTADIEAEKSHSLFLK